MLTTAQLSTLRTNIDATPELSAQPNNPDGHLAIANYYNQPAAPDFFIWRDGVPVAEIMSNGFDWTIVDNLTVGKARIWEWMANLGFLNFSHANVRAGINASINVTGTADDAMRLAIFGHGQKKATRGEKLFATGSGTTTSADGSGPATTSLIGTVQPGDVELARQL